MQLNEDISWELDCVLGALDEFEVAVGDPLKARDSGLSYPLLCRFVV